MGRPGPVMVTVLGRAAALVAAAAALAAPAAWAAPEIKKLKPYNQAPRLIDEATVQPLERARGQKALVLAFYSTECGPCQGELPELAALATRPGVELWVIALLTASDEQTGRCGGLDPLRAVFQPGHPLRERVLVDNCANLTKHITGADSSALPLTLVYTPKGEPVLTLRGRPRGATVEEALEATLAKLGSRR